MTILRAGNRYGQISRRGLRQLQASPRTRSGAENADACRSRRMIAALMTQSGYLLLGLTAVVLAELAWVLAGPLYHHPRAEVAQQLIDLLARQNIETIGVDKVEVQIALLARAAPTGAANFGDALLAACARRATRVRCTASPSRRARTAASRPRCLRSSSGSMRRVGISASPAST